MTDARPGRSPDADPLATTLAARVALIESSSIRAPVRAAAAPLAGGAPCGYDEIDVRILEWIASHRRLARPRDRRCAH